MSTPVGGPAGSGGSQAVPTVPAVTAGSADRAVALFDVDPDVIAARALSCPAVAGLSAGLFGGAVTYLPGRRVAGVRLAPTQVEVHVVARYGPSVGELAGQLRAALTGQVGGRRIDIVVEDLAEPATDGSGGSMATGESIASVRGPVPAPAAADLDSADLGGPVPTEAPVVTTPADPVPHAPLPDAPPPDPPAATGGSVVAARRPGLFRRS